MKTLTISFGFLILSFLCGAQNWAPVGATWYYTEYFAFSPDINYIKIESFKDTIIQGKTCKELIKRHNLVCADRPDTEFMYSENNKVYFLDTIFNSFQTLYDFGANAGDQWMIKIKNYSNPAVPDTLFVHIDSTTFKTINGIQLKMQYVTYHFHNAVDPGFAYSSVILERIGDTLYMFNFWPSSDFACDGNLSGGLRCYSDSVVGNYETGIADSCNYVYTGINEKSSASVNVYPNPVSDFIFIKSPGRSSFSFRLLNVLGIECLAGRTGNSEIDIKSLMNGIYFLELSDQSNTLLVCRKIIKK
ncbi:MAG: T9SS type A sorting domain-containing protein [Bacteroidales bacterium]|jgi:hypothetical protein